ncbi:MAG: gliding motility-associated C-terminal domain-containing protein [Saprospiraceae bacterium]|nr:gliding motility-associated C-terminal domain-containing protein [Saprospiraceae bacterium]
MYSNLKEKPDLNFVVRRVLPLLLMLLLGFGTIRTAETNFLMEEVCDNALDDDDDGLIDINDPDCQCEIARLESLVPNPSFEDYNCCPDDHSQMNCVRGWQQASGATTDYLNQCGYVSIPGLSPFPDGDGAVAFIAGSISDANGTEVHKEYAGVCLNFPMEKDVVYEFTFYIGFLDDTNSPPINFTFFGSPSCSNLPFTSGFDCPTNYPDWYLLNSQVFSVNETPSWKEVSMTIQPSVDINAIVIGDDCHPKGALNVYLLDNLILKNEGSLDFELMDAGSPCNPNFIFAVNENPDFLYQWYKEGIALPGETFPQLSEMYGEGAYQVRIINENTGKCRISEDYVFSIPVLERRIFETICAGEGYLFGGDFLEEAGLYEALFSSVEGCDSLVKLDLKVQENLVDTIYAQIIPGSSYEIGGQRFSTEGEHQVNIVNPMQCDSTIVLYVEFANVYIPNVFSPNGDNINDYFEVYAATSNYQSIEMQVFDRWGNLMFEGEKWDGTHKNQAAGAGVYVYLLRLVSTDGHVTILSNSLTLIR